MRFLVDQDVYAVTTRLLINLNHDVVTAAEIGVSQESDMDLLGRAHDENRLFVTRDRDFGGLVFLESLGAGIVYLRILPSTQNAVHQELERVLKSYLLVRLLPKGVSGNTLHLIL